MILKNADDLQPQLDELHDLRGHAQSGRQADAIQRCIDDMVTGRRGEAGVARHLAIAFEEDPEVLVLHDLRIEIGTVAAQIDHVVITPNEVCCIETKNMQHPVILDEDGSWSIEIARGRQRIDSPAVQAREHTLILGRWLKARGYGALLPTTAVVVNSKLEIRGSADWVDVEIVRAEKIAAWIGGARRSQPRDSLTGIDGRQLAHALQEAHRPVRVEWHTHFGLQRSVNRRAEPTEEDMTAARGELQRLAKRSRGAVAERFLLGELGGRGRGRGLESMLSAMVGINAAPKVPSVGMASTQGPVIISILPGGKYTFHPQGDRRAKRYIQRCAHDSCIWSGIYGNWQMDGKTAVLTLATMLADVREERGRASRT